MSRLEDFDELADVFAKVRKGINPDCYLMLPGHTVGTKIDLPVANEKCRLAFEQLLRALLLARCEEISEHFAKAKELLK